MILHDYGINWDEASHFFKGQAYLYYFTSLGKTSYDFSGHQRVSIYQWQQNSPKHYLENDGGHPPLSDILASVFNTVLYQQFNIAGDVESYNVYVVFVSTLLVFLVFLLAQEVYGTFAGIIAVISIISYPLFFGESHFNVKDPAEAAFYSWTIYSFYKGITRSSWRWILVSAIFSGLSFATKFNIVFLVFILAPWLVAYKWNDIKKIKWPFSRNITLSIASIPFIAFGILFASWPFLWVSPVNNFLKILDYYKSIGYSVIYQPSNYITFFGINKYASLWVLLTTPEVVIFFGFLGILYCLKNFHTEKNKTSFLILLWFMLPILRVTLPGAGIYLGVRQIMEYVPALAILSGIGATFLVRRFNKNSQLFLKVFCILLFIPIVLEMVRIHPNETVYFNAIAGGLHGAYNRGIPSAGNDLGNVYRQGVDWLNVHAEKNAKLTLVNNGTSAIPSVFIRKDIQFSADYWKNDKPLPDTYVMSTTEVGWGDIFPSRAIYLESFKPIFKVTVQGARILAIWKNP